MTRRRSTDEDHEVSRTLRHRSESLPHRRDGGPLGILRGVDTLPEGRSSLDRSVFFDLADFHVEELGSHVAQVRPR